MYWNKRIGTIALAFLLCCMTGCGKTEKIPALKEQKANSFGEFKVEKKSLQDVIYIQGYVAAKEYPQKFVKSGNIQEIKVACGDKVKKGDLIATLESEEESKKVKAKEREIQFQKEMYEVTKRQQDIDISLKKCDIQELQRKGDRSAIQAAEIDLKELEETCRYENERELLMEKQANEELKLLKKDLKEDFLYASHSGTVSFTLTALYETLAETNQPAVIISSDEELFIEPFDEVNQVTAANAKALVGYVNGIKVNVTRQTVTENNGETAKTKTVFPIKNPTKDMTGCTAVAGLVRDKIENSLVVPDQALYKGTEGYYVYLKEKQGKVKAPVKLGNGLNGYTIVKSGLKEGQTVLTYAGVRMGKNMQEETVTYGSMKDEIQVDLLANSGVPEVSNIEKKRIVNQYDKCILVQYFVQDGQMVQQGDKLYEIQFADSGSISADMESQLMQLKKEYLENQSELNQSLKEINRKKPESRLQTEQIKLKQEQLTIQYKKDLTEQKEKMKEEASENQNKIIYADVPGIVAVNGFMPKGSTLYQDCSMIVIKDRDRKEIAWSSQDRLYDDDYSEDPIFEGEPVSDFDRVQYGQRFTVKQGDKTIRGRLSMKYSDDINPSQSWRGLPSHLFRPDQDGELTNEQITNFTVSLFHIKHGIIIANSFINSEEHEDGVQKFVWVKNNDSLEKRYIGIGIEQTDQSWIVDGLEEGDIIVKGAES